MNFDSLKILNIQTIEDCRGNLSVVENLKDIPFSIGSCRWLYDIPSKRQSALNAKVEKKEIIVALSGSFDVEVVCNSESKKIALNSPSNGLLISQGFSYSIKNFSSNSVVMIISE